MGILGASKAKRTLKEKTFFKIKPSPMNSTLMIKMALLVQKKLKESNDDIFGV